MERTLESRFVYDPGEKVLFADLEGLEITSKDAVARIEARLDELLGSLDHKVYGVVNYTNFKLHPSVTAAYQRMMLRAQRLYSLGTVRYSERLVTRAFLRTAGTQSKVRANVCETRAEAMALLAELRREG